MIPDYKKNYRLLLLFNSCHKLRRMQIVNANLKNTTIKITPAPVQSKNPLLVLLRILLKNANSCWSRLLYSDSCTPEMGGVSYILTPALVLLRKIQLRLQSDSEKFSNIILQIQNF